MRPEAIHGFTRRQPFVPFRLITTEGRSYDIHHPDQIITHAIKDDYRSCVE